MITDLELAKAERARRKFINFIPYVWSKTEPFIPAHHVRVICDRMDRAIADYRAGKSTFLLVQLPFRHGKSELLSVHMPAYFLGHFPEDEVILCTYAQDMTNDFSRKGRDLITGEKYQAVFPHVKIRKDNHSVEQWQIEKHNGRLRGVALNGSITGKGAHLIALDDYYKNAEEAESQVMREKTWENFTASLMTRRAPVSIVLVFATPWHQDDVAGRIKKRMKEDSTFPKFDIINMPHKSSAYPSGYLFPERYSPDWYEGQASILGPYRASGLLYCDPKQRSGTFFEAEKIKVLEPDEFKRMTDGLLFQRAWDLSATLAGGDYTVGSKVAVHQRAVSGISEKQTLLFVDDVARFQLNTPERNAAIKRITIDDGPGVRMGLEVVGQNKDAYQNISSELSGIRHIQPIYVAGKNKMERAFPLSPIIAAGNLYLKRAPWNQAVIDELYDFPGAHDDIVDSLAHALKMVTHSTRISLS